MNSKSSSNILSSVVPRKAWQVDHATKLMKFNKNKQTFSQPTLEFFKGQPNFSNLEVTGESKLRNEMFDNLEKHIQSNTDYFINKNIESMLETESDGFEALDYRTNEFYK